MKRSVTKKIGCMNKGRRWWFLLTAIVIIGALCFWWLFGRADRKMREGLLSQARLMANAVNIERIKALTGTEADLASPNYLRLKEQLVWLRESTPNCRFVYLMGRKSDGTVFFFVDSEPAGSQDESPPGQVYEEISSELLLVFDKKIAQVEGPVTDRWGTWISAMVPRTDPKTGELIAVLGIDRDARFWKWEVATEDPVSTGFLLIIIIGLVAVLTATGRASTSIKPVMRRLLPVTSAVLLLMIGGGLWGMINIQKHQIRDISLIIKQQALGDMKQLLDEQARGLETVQVVLLRDTELIAALKEGDRGRLFDLSDGLFDELNARYNITHFYFSDAERVCLLRVHKPEKYGDRFDRFTALEAERTGQVASGIELGPLGTFTLRVVRPVFKDRQLLGYLELGKEIEDVLNNIVNYEGVQKILAIRKDAIDRALWEAGMAMLGREADWGRLPDHAVIFASIPFPAEAACFLGGAECGYDHTDTSHQIRFDEKLWQIMAEPVNDASGKHIGEMLLLYDVTALKADHKKFIGASAMVAGVLFAVLLALAFVMLYRTDANIRTQQAKLRESEELLSRTQEISKIGSWKLDSITNRLIWSDEVYRIFGYEPQAFEGTYEGFLDVVHPDDQAAVNEAFSRSQREDNDGYEIEHRIVQRNSGEVRHVHERCVHERDNSGAIIGSIGMVMDITKRKLAEETLRESEERHRLLTEHAVSAIAVHEIVFDSAGQPVDYVFLSVNPAFEIHTGLKAADVLGRRVTEVLPGIAKTPFIEIYGQVVLSGEPVSFEEYSEPLGRHYFITAYKIKENYFATAFNDITDVKKMQEVLHESEKRFMDVFYASPDAILLIGDNTFIDCNEATARMLKHATREEFLQTHPSALSPETQPDGRKSFEKAEEMMRLAFEQGFNRFEWIHRRANGEDFPVEVSLTPIIHEGRKLLYCVWRDISEVKKAQEKAKEVYQQEVKSHKIMRSMLEDNNLVRGRLEKSLEELKNAQFQLIQAEKMEAVGVMAAGIAHEVKNPLGIILQGINYFEEVFPADKKDNREILQMMKDSLKRADNIIRALLEFSRDQELEIKPQDINSVIEKSLSLKQHTFDTSNIEVVKELNEGLPAIFIDENKIEQFFIILFNNAEDAMPEGGKLYIRSYIPVTGKQTGVIIVEVEDTGSGIDKDIIDKIFDPFFTTKNKAKGTGLGLAVARSIIEMHEGLVHVESEKGKGAKFTIVFKNT